MSSEDKKQGVVNGVVVNSVGAAIAYDAEKEKNSVIILAYSKGNSNDDIRFTSIKPSKKGLLTRDDFIDAIRSAEKVRNVTYVDYDGTDKDIYVCRPCEGDVYDFVERDDIRNRYVDGFAEIEASNLKFSVDNVTAPSKPMKPLDATVSFSPTGSEYSQNTLEYAVMNAYNACLIGKVFSRDEFRLETGDGGRVKYEIRSVAAKYVDLSTLYVHPEINEGDNFVSSYVTEPMNVINGDEIITRIYKISYRATFDDYYLTRVN